MHLPGTWPLGRLTIPLEGLIKQIDPLLEGYCFQILAANQHPEAHNAKVLQTATHLTWILAEYLADTIAWLSWAMTLSLCDKDTQQLLTPKFWVLPLYRELLNSARHIRPSPSSERARGCTGLVKVICKENKEQKGKRKHHACTSHPNDRGGFTQWFGSCSLITTLYVWFPACWACPTRHFRVDRLCPALARQCGKKKKGKKKKKQPVGRRWWLRDYSASGPHQRGLPTRSIVGPTQGLP